MQNLTHRTERRNRRRWRRVLPQQHALQLLALFRALAHHHPIGQWDAEQLSALFNSPVVSDPGRAYRAGRRAGRMLARLPGESLRGLIAGVEEAMHAQQRGGQLA